MKQSILSISLTMLFCTFGIKAMSHDIEVKNADGITIYYIWNYEGTEISLSVCYRGPYSGSVYNEYSGKVTIPEFVIYENSSYKVTSICTNAFRECPALTSVIIPNSVTSIGEWAFYECSGLTSITIPNSVTSIGRYAFHDCSGLTSVTIPNSLTTIPEGLFAGCTSLTSVDIPNSVISIGTCAFGPTGLTSIDIPNSVISIGEYAFAGCKGLTSVTIPNSLTSIGQSVFERSGLTSVNIPNSVTAIYGSAFADTDLTSVIIPNSVTIIGARAFAGTDMTTVTIPNSVTSIGEYTFARCRALTSISLPASINQIDRMAFRYCSSLKDVICYSEKIPETHPNAFADSQIGKATLHVPVKSVSLYKQASPWSLFNKIIAIGKTDTYQLTYMVDGEVFKSYSLEEGATITPEPAPTKEGYTFSGWSNIPSTMPAHDVTVTGTFTINTYKLTYIVDGEVFKTYDVEYGASITPEPAPTKEGYIFSGWSEIPEKMPAHDVTVTGSFAVDPTPGLIAKIDSLIALLEEKEKVLYGKTNYNNETMVSEHLYFHLGTIKEVIADLSCHYELEKLKKQIKSGEHVTQEDLDNFRGDYSGLKIDEILSLADDLINFINSSLTSAIFTCGKGGKISVDDITVANDSKEIYWYYTNGWKKEFRNYGNISSFKINVVADEGYHIDKIELDGEATSKTEFDSDEITCKTIVATFAKDEVPTYKLTYLVDGEVYKEYVLEEGATITPEAEPTKEGYTFSGWSWIPKKMPAEDVFITGTFTAIKYKLTYLVDGKVYKEYDVECGATITREPEPTKEGYEFSGWSWIPSKMPAEDVVITGTFRQIDFNVGDVTYEISGEGTVTIKGGDQRGSVEISATVEINGQTYNVTAIAENAFKDNTGITSVTIPEGIQTIGDNAFSGCVGLIIINIGKDVAFIGNKAFANVGTASSARTRGESAFVVNCYAENIPQIAIDAFENAPIETGTLLVNDNLLEAYKTTSPWNRFGKIQGFNEAAGIGSIFVDSINAHIYDIQGNRHEKIQKGVNIIRTSDAKTKKVLVK